MTATGKTDEIRIGFVAGGDARRTAALEDEAIDSLWVGGHVASRNPSPEAMMGLARLAALTERVKIGTSILLLPLYPPALVAKQIADLDRATDGRVILGVGVGGEYPQEFRACEVPIKERGRRTDEMIPLIRRAVDRRGDHPRGPLLLDGGRADPSRAGAGRRSADRRGRAAGAGDAARRDAGRRVVPLPLLAASLRGVGRDGQAGRRRGGPRPRRRSSGTCSCSST